ncbi:META domain-containing protein [Marinobacter daepoensis]|uniref:META domain-containing protein n=1 Tax=Marinobacter daepoensis TaxID=262077 RepID=UPI001C96F60D|nr:META domain-containing protein [Marinobacter daepoensis]MBY6033827.1 META domain-containing protein [Marinobacter daepoensis]
MFLRRVLSVSAVALAGALVSACASDPANTGLSDFGRYQCGQLDVAVKSSEDDGLIGLEYLNRRVLLKEAKSASGALFVAPGDPETQFWSKGERATLTLRGETLPECLEPGAIESSFRAMGTEPFWSILLENGEMALTRPYDQRVSEGVRLSQAVANRHGRVYEAALGDETIEVRVAHQLCEDLMAGAQYPAQVRLTLGNETFEGCGGDRHRLFRGPEWVVEDLAGLGIIDRSRMTLRFLADNRVAGRASCNHYSGRYTLTGEGLTFSQQATTLMACAPPLMNQERRFLELLEQVRDARIGRSGELLLETSAGDVIRAIQSDKESP